MTCCPSADKAHLPCTLRPRLLPTSAGGLSIFGSGATPRLAAPRQPMPPLTRATALGTVCFSRVVEQPRPSAPMGRASSKPPSRGGFLEVKLRGEAGLCAHQRWPEVQILTRSPTQQEPSRCTAPSRSRPPAGAPPREPGAEPIAPPRRSAPFSLPAIGGSLLAHNGDGQPITAMPVEKDRPTPRADVAGAVEIALTIHLDEARPARQSRRSEDGQAHQGQSIGVHRHLPSSAKA